MTKKQAEEKAARLTAAGTPTMVEPSDGTHRDYRTRTIMAHLVSKKRNNQERVANGKKRIADALLIRKDVNATARRIYANKKAYELALFEDAPTKRISAEAERVVVLSDLQIPFEDGPAVDQALVVLHSVNPDMIILNGDIVDCYAESSFLKDALKAERTIPATHERLRMLLSCLQHVPKKIWLGGNHEERWRKVLWSDTPSAKLWLQRHQEASGLDGIDLLDPVRSFAKLFNAQEYGFEYYPYGHRLYLAEGNLIVTHGKYVSRHSGWSAKRTWEWLGKSCIVGHTHRLGSYLITQDGQEMGAWENGCLCVLEPEYDDAPNWQQGFSIIRISGPEFHVIQVPIIRRAGKPVAVYHGDT